ncbi:MAG TPA: diaminopimelate epimerase [Porphyromonadaceae bacterium]|jgi:diaminopimelate epimerase|nr:diaminopimelate epimerase [Porphyromonadaceae bacterium]HBK32898.1 diaminopimelate epimerase [Porphyromonadaceae bacterium]HBL34432.1 diaminopimelate epimerase [Porphyromonadaceae bacterium]HBX44785.1 diaminopimelate epimerase [Porphyromonadaceae bacterium]HCM20240.1 diaminopimelate epimerase [Porphyromonadaceae bacterium]
MKFVKMQGAGNDYIYFNLFEEKIESPAELSRRVSDRHFGIGGDGIVLIGPSAEGDFSMRMFNADGSEAEMCGNASRCVGKYLYDRGLTRKKEIALSTKSGIKRLLLEVDPVTDTVVRVNVNMGRPRLSAHEIPVALSLPRVVHHPLEVEGYRAEITCVSMGNPHAVIFQDDIERFDFSAIGPAIEHHPLFPQRTNVEFVQVLDRQNLRMRVWERGSGETLACGTGACATVVAGVLNNVCDAVALVHVKGGDLLVEWDRSADEVWLSGDAHFVFEGFV